MINIKTMNKIAEVGLSKLDKSLFTCSDNCADPEGILVRSAALHEYDFDANPSLAAIARAGAGVNNIPIPKCTEKGICVFNTPGANANAVKEMVLCALFLANRKVVDGINWVKTIADKGDEIPALVEKGKSAFGGPEIQGKTLGVIGLGAIGAMVATAATHLGMTVYGYDPFITIDSAWNLSNSVIKAESKKEIYEKCDYITYHIPLNAETKGSLNAEAIDLMKNGVRILNFSRAEIADFDALSEALEKGKVAAYVTDFPNAKVMEMKNTVAIPHLAASTPESEDNCAEMAALQIADYILNGNIKNSVNLPEIRAERTDGTRICVIQKNVPKMLNAISEVIAHANLNIENMTCKSKGDVAYVIIDLSGKIEGNGIAHKISNIEGVLKVRVIN